MSIPRVDSREFNITDEFLALVKSHCSIDFSDDDELLNIYIHSVLSSLEGYDGKLGIFIGIRTVTQDFDSLNTRNSLIGPWVDDPNFPIFTYLDTDENRVPVPEGFWNIDNNDAGLELVVDTKAINSIKDFYVGKSDIIIPDKFQFVYKAGLGVHPQDLPKDLQFAILLMVRRMYDYRDDTMRADRVNIPHGASDILDRYKVQWVG